MYFVIIFLLKFLILGDHFLRTESYEETKVFIEMKNCLFKKRVGRTLCLICIYVRNSPVGYLKRGVLSAVTKMGPRTGPTEVAPEPAPAPPPAQPPPPAQTAKTDR